ncbi:MAG TPA: hypothetical protein VGM18_02350 [Candidatus Sulfotelmatobacter sp.]
MSFRLLKFVTALAMGTAAACGFTAQAPAQTPTPVSKRPQSSRHKATPAKIYEDREINVVIPAGWRIVPDAALKDPDGLAISLASSVSQAEGKLILEKNGYTLGLAYRTGHASGIEGGRLNEAFNIPWPGVEDVAECGAYLRSHTQPASRIFIFNNLIVDPADPKARESCGLDQNLKAWSDENGMKRRWFGGNFATADAGLFLDSLGEGCGQKLYTLTFQARHPERLPDDRDPNLKKMIGEAIDIVNSIHYERCPPAP